MKKKIILTRLCVLPEYNKTLLIWICTCAYIITPVVLQIQTPKRTKLNIAARNKVTQPLFKKQSLHTTWCRCFSKKIKTATRCAIYADVWRSMCSEAISATSAESNTSGCDWRRFQPCYWETGHGDHQIVSWQRICTFPPPPAASHSSAFLPERALALFSCQARQPRALLRCVLWHVNSQTEQWVGPWGRLKSGGRTF